MTLNITLTRASYPGNGSAKVFAFSFVVREKAHLRVFTGPIGGALVEESPATWSITGLDNPNGGSITWPVLGPALGVTGRIVLQREVPFTQRTNYVNQSAFYPEIIEGDLDLLTMQTQQLDTRDDDLEAALTALQNRALRVPEASVDVLPSAAARASRLLGFDSSGRPSLLSGGDQSVLTVVAAGSTTPRSLAERFADEINVLDFGAKGDGVTNDSPAFAAALLAAAGTRSKIVRVPATGAAYVIEQGLTVLQGVQLVGDGPINWYGPIQPLSLWTLKGSWLHFKEGGNPGLTLAGVGCKLRGLNFCQTQPEPSYTPGVAWAPTTQPYTVHCIQNFFEIEDCFWLNCSHGINIDYPLANGGGTYSRLNKLSMGCYGNSIRFHRVNDTMSAHNIHDRNMWHVSNPNVVAWQEANHKAWILSYVDNLQASHVEFFQCETALFCEDGRVAAGAFDLTHSTSFCQFSVFLFNCVKHAIRPATTTTTIRIAFTNVVAQTDPTTNVAGEWLFDLRSDNAFVKFDGFWVPYAGNGVLKIGAGLGGSVRVTGLSVDGYSWNAANQAAFVTAFNAFLDLPDGVQEVNRPFGAGEIVKGDGAVRGFTFPSNFEVNRGGGSVNLVPGTTTDTFTGYAEFRAPDGTVHAYVGRCSVLGELNLVSNQGSVNITSGGTRIEVRNDGVISFTDANGVRKASINMGTGNMVLAGTLTQNSVP